MNGVVAVYPRGPSIRVRGAGVQSSGPTGTHSCHPDLRRICDPYITQPLLQEEFGDLAADVASKYLEENQATHRYSFRPTFSRHSTFLLP